jgi:hypothetical protein
MKNNFIFETPILVVDMLGTEKIARFSGSGAALTSVKTI